MFDKELVGMLYQEAGIFSPKNLGVLNHMMGVTHVAGFLGHELNRRNVLIDVDLVENAAMVHDIGKIFDDTLWGHVEEGVKFLQKQGVDERIIHLVQVHQIWQREVTEPLTWEEKLIILGDLSFRERIMCVKERVEDIISRYTGPKGIPQGEERWIRKLSEDIHQEISEMLSVVLPF